MARWANLARGDERSMHGIIGALTKGEPSPPLKPPHYEVVRGFTVELGPPSVFPSIDSPLSQRVHLGEQ